MQKFQLNSQLNPKNYKNCNNIKNISQWKAKILTGNSLSNDKEVNNWEEVGYVWVSLVDNTIVPLARSDEHHRGYDALMDMNIKANDYYPVFLGADYYDNGDNNQYPYNQKEAQYLKIALLKLKYFGRDLNTIKVNMSYILQDFSTATITATEFVEGKYGEEKYKDNELTPLGEKLLKTLEQLSSTYTYIIEHQSSSDRLFKVVNNLYELCDDIKLDSGDKLFNSVMLDNIYEAMEMYDSGKGSRQLETTLFSFGGIRNTIHQALRMRKYEENLNKQLGNVSKIVEMIGSI